MFDPARRWRGGRRELVWHGAHAPEDGDWCVAEVPDEGEAFLVELLGAEDRPAWDDAAVASQYRLRRRFPERAEAEAAAFAEPSETECGRRLDATDRLTFTIDPEDARDHDDALSIARLEGEHQEVGIHIADVSHYVRPGSAIDDEAVRRGTSCYLPGGVIPMLPERLSAELCSLVPGRRRLAISVFVEFDRLGAPCGARFSETVIRSRHALVYEEVQRAFDGERTLPAPVLAALDALRLLARALRDRRFREGALALDVPESRVRVDADGVPIAIERRRSLESHTLIEEFMLLANRCVGGEGATRGAGMLYRIHDAPGPHKLMELEATLKTLGLPRPAPGIEPARALQSVLSARLDEAHQGLLHRIVLRSLARARYLERDQGHFGLAARGYCHFTSPIRRYPDLHNHRRVKEWIRGQKVASADPLALAALADLCSAREADAAGAEREAVRVKGLRLLEMRLGDRASGIISGLNPHGFFVELDAMPVEGFVRVSSYLDDQFTLDATGVRMVGRRTRRRFALGDAVQITVARVDVAARQADFAIEESKRPRRR